MSEDHIERTVTYEINEDDMAPITFGELVLYGDDRHKQGWLDAVEAMKPSNN